ncbi:MAG: ABC transporter permease, partial [Vulcanimicrobiaceae bacterium]
MMYFDEALRVLLANKLRSLLTITGLIIGVGAVIAIQVLGASMAGAVNGSLGVLADNSFVVFPNSRQRNVSRATIRLSDLSAIERSIPGIISGRPLGLSSQLVRVGHVLARFNISPEGAPSFSNLPVIFGRNLITGDISGATNVCVLANDAYVKLFPNGGDPTGQSLYAGSRRFVIIGVLAAPKRGFLNLQFSGDITIPWTTFVRDYNIGQNVFGAGFLVTDASKIPQIEIAVQDKLRALHGGGKDIQYQTADKAKFTQGVGGIFNAVTLIVGLIGAVSLLVAGIGIMNIMLVSVAERTR